MSSCLSISANNWTCHNPVPLLPFLGWEHRARFGATCPPAGMISRLPWEQGNLIAVQTWACPGTSHVKLNEANKAVSSCCLAVFIAFCIPTHGPAIIPQAAEAVYFSATACQPAVPLMHPQRDPGCKGARQTQMPMAREATTSKQESWLTWKAQTQTKSSQEMGTRANISAGSEGLLTLL